MRFADAYALKRIFIKTKSRKMTCVRLFRMLSFCLLICAAYTASPPYEIANLRITNADRLIDAATQIVKYTQKLTIENKGSDVVEYFVFTVDPATVEYVQSIKAHSKESDRLMGIASVGKGKDRAWLIKFENGLRPGKEVAVVVLYTAAELMRPYPTEITQNERQLVKLTGNCYLYSPYPIDVSTTSVSLGTRNVESYSKHEPTKYTDANVLYGPYVKVKPNTYAEYMVHFENNSPFLVAPLVERWIEVSHWGNVAVREEVTLEHVGARLKGPFSRYDFQRADSGFSAVRSFRAILPPLARDIYYRDEIGNISTSSVQYMDNMVELDLRPRFPLFGGWNTKYTIGYNLPSYGYLFHNNDKYALKMPLMDHLFDEMVVRKAIIKIVLPEGSRNYTIRLPDLDVDSISYESHFTYLDTVGRPVLVVQKSNLVDDDMDAFVLRYEFPKQLLVQEPLLLIGALIALFGSVMVYVRLDFSLSKDEQSEQRLKVVGICEKLCEYANRKLKLYKALEDKMNVVKYNKDGKSFANAIRSFNADHQTFSTTMADLNAKLKAEAAPDMAERFAEISKADKQLKEVFVQHASLYMEKLLPGKINKAAFTEAEANFAKKRDELTARITKALQNLE